MYASRATPVQRMRGRRHSTSTRGISPSPKRRSLNVGVTSPKMNGDYHVLKQSVEKERNAVQTARVALASSLDQLGEHHVRQQEYDDAMDAFTEALREKRSVFWQFSPNEGSISSRSRNNSTSSFTFTSSLGGGGECGDSTLSGGAGSTGGAAAAAVSSSDKAIDEIVNTLRNMGNVHSLRGEQDEAMRYYTEVTNLRAQKSSNASCDPSWGDTTTKSLPSALNIDDTSTLMSEINEDVKALDDLFRSISFRHQGSNNNNNNNLDNNMAAAGTNEKRKSKSSMGGSPSSSSGGGAGPHNNNNNNNGCSAPSNKRRKNSSSNNNSSEQNNIVENEPFKRESTASSLLCSSPNIPASGNEVSEAMDMYQSVLESSYPAGPRLDQHKELLNSLALRADLLNEQTRNKKSPVTEPSPQPDSKALSKAADLELALEIYRQILVAHEENLESIKQESSSSSSSSSQEQQQQPQPANSTTNTNTNTNADTTQIEQAAASNVASTLICMGSIYYKLGNRVEELHMYKEAKGVYRRAFGENHTFVAGTRKNIGMVLAERGEYEEAMDQFDNAKRIYLSVNHGSEMNRDVASAISCMGNVKNRVGELDAALTKYMEALTIYKSIHNEGSADNNDNNADALRDVTSTLKVIGMVHAKKGDLDTAMGFFQEAMTLLRSSGIDNSSAGRETTASVLTRIASIHLKKGDLDHAMAHYREAYDLTVRNRGTTNHQEVAGILHYIGGIYHKRADYDEAMTCYQEAIRIYHATLGPGNPTVAGTLVMVGSIYYKRRNLDSAMMFYREALRLNRDAYGMHHPDVAPILKSIGTILTKKGDYHEAYDIFRDVLSIKCTIHGTDHPEVASAYKSLGNVHYKLGDLADAERQYRHALSIYRRTKGEEHADTVAAKTTIEHLRYWMREREQRQLEQRHTKNTSRREESDERSC